MRQRNNLEMIQEHSESEEESKFRWHDHLDKDEFDIWKEDA